MLIFAVQIKLADGAEKSVKSAKSASNIFLSQITPMAQNLSVKSARNNKLLSRMKIANIELPDRAVMLAPMEDVTDVGFRLQCKQFGADMVYSEFVSADALIRSIDKTMQKWRRNVPW